MKRTGLTTEICHSLSDNIFQIETEVVNSLNSIESIGKNRRRYAA